MVYECSFLALSGILFCAVSSPDNGVKCFACENCIINNETEPLSVFKQRPLWHVYVAASCTSECPKTPEKLMDHIAKHINENIYICFIWHINEHIKVLFEGNLVEY